MTILSENTILVLTYVSVTDPVKEPHCNKSNSYINGYVKAAVSNVWGSSLQAFQLLEVWGQLFIYFWKTLDYKLISLNCGQSYQSFNHVLESRAPVKNV